MAPAAARSATVRFLAAGLLLAGLLMSLPVTAASALPVFRSSVATVTAADLPYSWRAGCPVAPTDLRLLRLTYLGFDGVARTGELVVHVDSAVRMQRVFRRLYEARFPIARMVRVDAYRGDDDASMAANNTSAFNCRRISGTTSWSWHAYGRAVDLNPVQNPYVRGSTVEPPAGRAYLDRRHVRPGMVVAGSATVQAFAAEGWSWGGAWQSAKDYQHFESRAPLLGERRFVRVVEDGGVYRIAGGAPVAVTSWAPFGGPQPSVGISRAQLASLLRHPSDGVFLRAAGRGDVYRVAGGAPVHVTTWSAFGAPQPSTDVDPAALDRAGAGAPFDRVRAWPADGTFVRPTGSTTVFRFAGGAPLPVTSWSAVGGRGAVTDVDPAAIDRAGAGGHYRHVRAWPVDGVYLRSGATNRVYVTRNGYALWLSSWAQVGGPKPTTTIDQAVLDNAGGSGVWRFLRGTGVYVA